MAEPFAVEARSFGKIAVPAPGTPVRVTSDVNLRAVRLRFAVVIGETGRVFLGVAGMNKATGAGVLKEFWPTGAGGGIADELVLESVNGLRPAVASEDKPAAPGRKVLRSRWMESGARNF